MDKYEEFEIRKQRILFEQKYYDTHHIITNDFKYTHTENGVNYYDYNDTIYKEIECSKSFFKYYIVNDDNTYKYVGFLYKDGFKGLLSVIKDPVKGKIGLITIAKFVR